MSLREIINRVSKFGVLNSIVGFFEVLFHKNRFRILKSLYLNLRVLPFKQAIRLPIVIYGKSKILSLLGRCHIEGPIKFGMIKFGAPNKVIMVSCDKTYIRINGSVFFNGKADFQTGMEFNVLSGKLWIGKDVVFGEKSKLICVCDIHIGDYTRIASLSSLMDTDFHYLLNLDTRMINKCFGAIFIGKYCWIGSRTAIQKGTFLPDFVVCASGSFLSKNYMEIPSYSLIGGSPAKLIKTNLVRVWSTKKQMFLHQLFKDSPERKFYQVPNGVDLEEFWNK